MKVIFSNVQSIVKKIDEVRAWVAITKPDIFVATETWANSDLGDALFGMDGYDLIAREDRNDTERGRGGGIMVYAEKSLQIWKVEIDTDFNQYASVCIKCGREEINLHVIYRSPNSKKENDDELCGWIRKMPGKNSLGRLENSFFNSNNNKYKMMKNRKNKARRRENIIKRKTL